ncbi:signal transduction histidine kinase [Streptomyces calvus]
MRAPVQKSRPRRKGKQTAPAGDEQTPTVGRGRPTHVRNRLIVAVAVVAAAIAGAGSPSVLAASGQLHDAQELVTLAGQTQDALTLAHSLADERDDVVPYIAAGRPKSKAPTEAHSARVDRQVEELRADTDTSQALRDDLDAIAAVRRAALTGKSSALEAHEAYSTAITELHRLAEQLAERTPPRAGSGAHALAELDSAVQQAAATRGLLLAALSVPSSTQTVIDPITGLPSTTTGSSDADAELRDELTAAALQARLRSDAALADFRDAAPKAARTSYASTVTGPEVDAAEKYLAALTDEPSLSDDELSTSTEKVRAALTARIETMRGVESALFDRRTKDLAQLRDDDVTALEIRIAALGALMLLAVGIATAMARTLTRPLSVLRRGSARLAGAEDLTSEEPVAFTGRNDEFAQVVRSVNALHANAVALAERIATLETDRKHLVGQRQKMADAREELRTELAESTAHLERLRTSIGSTFVNLALRTLGLVERQLGVIEGLEEREDDPERLATLFKLDHFATVMRRHSENLLVLAGTEHVQHTAGPVPLVDVVRAAVSEIERYERVRIAALPPHAHIAGFAADDLSHLLAELMENATSFSPPDLPVEVSGWLLENGEVMLSVQDEGIGMTGDRLERLNARLSEFDADATYDAEGEDGLGLGLYVVARLAHRHGVRVQLREQKQGGIAAVVVLPDALLASATPTAVPGSVSGAASTVSLPGADAEANSNVLHGRTEGTDPLIALAEKAVHRSESAGEPASGDAAADGAARKASDPVDGLADRRADDVAAGHPQEAADGAAHPGTERTAPDRADDTAARHPADEEAGRSAGPDGAPHAGDTGPAQSPAEMTMELLIPAQPDGTDEPSTPDDPAAPGDHGPATGTTRAGHPATAPDSRPAEPAPPARTPEDTAPDVDLPGAGHAAGAAGPAAPHSEDAVGRGALPTRPRPAGAGDEHTRVPDGPDGQDGPDGEDDEQVTAKGLPKRTPRITAPAETQRPRGGSVDAEALRRRLGGFRRGADAGRRDVEAELAERTGHHRAPTDQTTTSEEATGGTVEEASS